MWSLAEMGTAVLDEFGIRSAHVRLDNEGRQ